MLSLGELEAGALREIDAAADQAALDEVRVRYLGKKGSLTLAQRYGNWLASFLLNIIFRTRFTDLGPFRAVKWDRLKALNPLR